MKEISLTQELMRLHKHISMNSRSILSAAFGNGKTTLLRQFQEKFKNEYLFITLHPVNYSVATNEDVFEYIKRDILVQMKNQGVSLCVPKYEDYSKALITKENILGLIGFLISIVGGSIAQKIWDTNKKFLSKSLDLAEDVEKEMHDFHHYENVFKSQRGGIYEYDAYSILIEKNLDAVHSNGGNGEGNKTLLIIEDLDRIDPAHLFRILNVFGAHIDTDNGSNKFGFTNLLFVLDYGTTKQMFHHFYGSKANYAGYMSKFLCSHVFAFNIKHAARMELFSYIANECLLSKDNLKSINISESSSDAISLYSVINAMSVRDIAHVLDGVTGQIRQNDIQVPQGKISSDAPITKLFAVLVRLNRQVDFRVVYASLDKSKMLLKVLGKFLLCKQIFYSVGFEYRFSYYHVVATDEGEGYLNATIQSAQESFSNKEPIDSELIFCYNQAMNAVWDCQYLD